MPMENTSMTSLAPHFESILDTLSDGVFISDAEGTTLFVNKMYETPVSYTHLTLPTKRIV